MDSFPVFPRSAVHARTISFLTAEFEWDRVNQLIYGRPMRFLGRWFIKVAGKLFKEVRLGTLMVDLEERLHEARNLSIAGKFAEAHALLEAALPEATATKSSLLADFHNEKGVALRMLRRYSDAARDYWAALRLRVWDAQGAEAYINLADLSRVSDSDFAAAHSYLDDALTLVGNETLLHARAVDQRGLVFLGQKDYASAVVAFQRASEICRDLYEGSPADPVFARRLGQILQHFGAAYLHEGKAENFEWAADTQLEALELFKSMGDPVGVFNAVTTLGKLTAIQNDHSRALGHYQRAWAALEPTGYARGIAVLAFHMMDAHAHLGHFDAAASYMARFVAGVTAKDVVAIDLTLLAPRFEKVLKLYEPSGCDASLLRSVQPHFTA